MIYINDVSFSHNVNVSSDFLVSSPAVNCSPSRTRKVDAFYCNLKVNVADALLLACDWFRRGVLQIFTPFRETSVSKRLSSFSEIDLFVFFVSL